MRVLVTGSTGLVGTALCERLKADRHQVVRLVRTPPRDSSEVAWNPNAGTIDAAACEGMDAVIHLAGENIAGARWNERVKREIRDSRVKGTDLLARTLASLSNKPKTLISASAIGYYGDRGDERLTEQSSAGHGFLPEVCQAWEHAARPAASAGIRVVYPRIGVVLSPKGGALKKMLLPFQLGLGGVLGNGKQYMSWISLDDLVSILINVLDRDSLSGAVNATAPEPVTNHQYTKTLGSVLGRPTIFPMPAFAARLAFGEMADALLLASARVEPARLLGDGFSFAHPSLNQALESMLR